MPDDREGRVVLLTGAAGGIGRARAGRHCGGNAMPTN
jgi:NAD(P)-dependent dehydrogenase (short-subunit alcohol dehydrogenase family)